MSSDRPTVLWVLSAPTVSAPGVLPGETIAPMTGVPSSVLPRLPADDTTTRPAETARSTASASGSVRYDSVAAWPSDILTTRSL